MLHTAAYRELGLSGWTYQAIECDEARLPALLGSLGPGWAGLSLTMPLKRAVLPLLDRSDSLVAQVGAANTVLLADGTRSGYNTDVPGMVTALGAVADGSRGPGLGTGGSQRKSSSGRSRAHAGAGPAADRSGIDTADRPVLILGGGATACSAMAALHRAGVRSVTAAVRDPASAVQPQAVAGRLGMELALVTFGPGQPREHWLARQHGRPWRLLLSTVPAGAADSYADLLAAGELTAAAVFDVVYHPWPTRLAAAAATAGVPVISGFELLLHQAAEQVRLMTGLVAPVAAMRAAGLAALAARS